MTTKPLTPLAIVCCLLACTSQPKESTTGKTAITGTTSICYQYVGNKDTIALKTIDDNGVITGDLVYNLYEKDKNTGTIRGQMKGDTLFAQYTFSSEGVESVRPVIFRKMGNTFMEESGGTDAKNEKMPTQRVDSLAFSHPIVLRMTDCNE